MKRLLLALSLLSAVQIHAAVAPDFRERTVEGPLLSLHSQFKPGRAVLVTFWATWCGPCIEELRTVRDHLLEDPTLPLDVIGVNVDGPDTVVDVKPTMRMHKLEFPVVLDTKQEIFSRYNPSKSLPYSVLVRANGEVAATFQGYQENMFTVLRNAVGK